MHIIIIEKKIIFHRFWRNFSVNSCSKESLFQGVREIPPWWIPPIESPRKLPLVHSLNYRLAKFHPPPRWIPTWVKFRVRVRVREFDQVGIYRGGAIYQGRIWPGGSSPGGGGGRIWSGELTRGDFPSTLFQKTSQWMISYLFILYLLIAFKANFLI